MYEEKKRKIDWFFQLMNDYADIQEELEEAMLTLEYIQAEIRYAMEELRDEMETVEKHMESSRNRLYRFRKPRLSGLCGERSPTAGSCQ